MIIQNAEIHDAGEVAKLVRGLSNYYLEKENGELPIWLSDSITDSAFLRRFNDREYHNYIFKTGGLVVGYICIKNGFHLYHLFVSAEFHKKGIAKNLWEHAIKSLSINNCTVRSSLYAVPVYSRLGFVISGHAESKEDIGYQPMVYSNADC
ncbi:GNAT family N-acetyltransferase [Pseudomonas leptonychotis]|uniref:GNAT family N-acetyltransferase n=1 Tax=Pseudomonas leptonychotis TaxID=2448482 RepID=UPI0039F0CE6E